MQTKSLGLYGDACVSQHLCVLFHVSVSVCVCGCVVYGAKN